MGVLICHSVGAAVAVQDLGRAGLTGLGISRGGAMDRLALLEATALLGAPHGQAALEMAGMGGCFEVTEPTRIALTGATMAAKIDGAPIGWNQSHRLLPGHVLDIGAATAGIYGDLSFAGGIDSPIYLYSRATHLTAAVGGYVSAGDRLQFAPDPEPNSAEVGMTVEERFSGGDIGILPGPQTDLFSTQERQSFKTATFTVSHRVNRQGIGLDHPNLTFSSDLAAGLASDFIQPGDVQMTGEGVPYVLMAECQTTGGYPRLGTVLPSYLPRLAQSRPGSTIRFRFVDFEKADASEPSEAALLAALRAKVRPMVRNPAEIADLLGYQLISGVTAGDDLEDLS